MKRKIWIIGVVVVAALSLSLLAAGGLVQADEAVEKIQGRVTQVGATALTVETRDGEVQVVITEETVIRMAGVADASLGDIPEGALVLIRSEEEEDGLLVAQLVVVHVPRQLADHALRGIVTDVEGERVSVETDEGETATLLLTDTTRLWVPGEPLTTTVALEIGDPVLALGQPAGASTGDRPLSARLVVVVSDEDLPKVVIRGRAVVATQQTLVVKTGLGERAITVTPRTHLWSADGELESLRQVQPGEQVLALGQPTEFGQWLAGLVVLPNSKPLARHGLSGRVTVKDATGHFFVVQTHRGDEITVQTDEKTRYRVPGVEDPSFDDIQVGDTLVALGRFEDGPDAAFLARGIGVKAAPAGE